MAERKRYWDEALLTVQAARDKLDRGEKLTHNEMVELEAIFTTMVEVLKPIADAFIAAMADIASAFNSWYASLPEGVKDEIDVATSLHFVGVDESSAREAAEEASGGFVLSQGDRADLHHDPEINIQLAAVEGSEIEGMGWRNVQAPLHIRNQHPEWSADQELGYRS